MLGTAPGGGGGGGTCKEGAVRQAHTQRERERERHTQRERERERDRDRERQRERERDRAQPAHSWAASGHISSVSAPSTGVSSCTVTVKQ